MSNVTTRNPWVIDTASATPITTGPLKLVSIRWVGATTAGHHATVVDGAGLVVWDSVAAGANTVESDLLEFTSGLWVTGLAVTVLGSGKLYITYG